MRVSPYGIIFNSKGGVLLTSWGRPSETSGGHPKDVLISFYEKKNPREKEYVYNESVFSLRINKCYITKMTSTAGWRCEKKEYELRVLNWITRRIYFFHQKRYEILFMFLQCNKFLQSKLPNFTTKLTIHNEKNICHQQWSQSNVNLARFIDILYEQLKVRNVI